MFKDFINATKVVKKYGKEEYGDDAMDKIINSAKEIKESATGLQDTITDGVGKIIDWY